MQTFIELGILYILCINGFVYAVVSVGKLSYMVIKHVKDKN